MLEQLADLDVQTLRAVRGLATTRTQCGTTRCNGLAMKPSGMDNLLAAIC